MGLMFHRAAVAILSSSSIIAYSTHPSPPEAPPPSWEPKNKEVRLPAVAGEVVLTEEQWTQSNFPTFPVPRTVSTHVRVEAWRDLVQDVSTKSGMETEAATLDRVLSNLQEGADSGVKFPGTIPTRTPNHFPHPATDIPRIWDAIATEVKQGRMAGPLPPGSVQDAKVNGFMAVTKGDGGRRQVGNLSSPEGSSFNDGIDDSDLKEWAVHMLQATEVSTMIAECGTACLISCLDVKAAYKSIPVSQRQRRLQVFQFMGKWFLDLRLVFGDRMACCFFDRFHSCILYFLVLSKIPLPDRWVGKCIDDVINISPATARDLAGSFASQYRRALDLLNMEAAPLDPTRRKSFELETSGECLGVWFCSLSLTWTWPKLKLARFLQKLHSFLEAQIVTLQTLQEMVGSMLSFIQLAPSLGMFMANVLHLMASVLSKEDKSVDLPLTIQLPQSVHQDARLLFSIAYSALQNPIPLVNLRPQVSLSAHHAYTDISGDMSNNASLGIYVPATQLYPSLVASIPFHAWFMFYKQPQEEEEQTQMSFQSTVLESLGPLVTMACDPWRFANGQVVFHIDNYATCLAYKKGRGKKAILATVLVRAARVVAAALNIRLVVQWERRRSSRGGEISDNLTHNMLGGCSDQEVQSFLSRNLQTFPPPIMRWMADPSPTSTLGLDILVWIREVHNFPSWDITSLL